MIINEFGDVGLDHELIEASEDSVDRAADRLPVLQDAQRSRRDAARSAAAARRGPAFAFDRVVIETSGLADPAPILQTLMTDAAIADRIVLGGVVTTVDAVNGTDTLDREEISAKQVAVADRLILTKTDLAGPVQPALVRRLEALNATAPVIAARHGQVDPQCLFDGHLYDPLTKSVDVQSWLGAEAPAHANPHGHRGIDTFAVLRREPVRAVALTLFLEAIAEHCGADLLRLKGIVNILESPDQPAVIHGVQHVFHPPSWLARLAVRRSAQPDRVHHARHSARLRGGADRRNCVGSSRCRGRKLDVGCGF